MSKKTFATLGMIVSVVLVLVSILIFTGVMGGDADYPGSASYSYDSGYASFGADFYTYVSNNAAEAASASRTAANNVRELCDLMKNVCGSFMLGFGLLGFAYFGIVRCDCKKEELVEPVYIETEVPVETTDETAEE